MKKLICQKDIESMAAKGEKTVCVDADTIMTPSAKDAAKNAGIEIRDGVAACCTSSTVKSQNEACCQGGEISADMFYTVLKTLAERGLLHESLARITGACEEDESGLRLCYGSQVVLDPLDTGTPGAKASYKEVFGSPVSSISSGFLEIDNSRFDWKLEGEEINYIIEGDVSISINGRTYTGKGGDVFYLPAGAKVVWETKGKARMFYATR